MAYTGEEVFMNRQISEMQRAIIPPEFAPRNTKTTHTPICFGKFLHSEVIADKLDMDSSTIRKVVSTPCWPSDLLVPCQCPQMHTR
jgi:hypothetical protein